MDSLEIGLAPPDGRSVSGACQIKPSSRAFMSVSKRENDKSLRFSWGKYPRDLGMSLSGLLHVISAPRMLLRHYVHVVRLTEQTDGL